MISLFVLFRIRMSTFIRRPALLCYAALVRTAVWRVEVGAY